MSTFNTSFQRPSEVDLSFARLIGLTEAQAIEQYRMYDMYYDGAQLPVLPTQLQETITNLGIIRNLCALVVNTYCSKLSISSFSSEASQDTVDELVKKNHLPLIISRVHKGGAKYGDSFLRLWHTDKDGTTMQVLTPENVRPVYAQDGSQKMLWCKVEWLENESVEDESLSGSLRFYRRKDVYYPDHVERFMMQGAGILPSANVLDTGAWQPYTGEGTDNAGNEIKYDWGRIPIVHFRNRPDESDFGNSELLNAIPIQKDKDQAEMDLCLRAIFAASGQLYITGFDQPEYEAQWRAQHPHETPPKLSRDPWVVWNFPSEGTKVGRLAADDLTQFISYSDKLTDDMANITQTPVSYLKGLNVPSGVALKEIAGPLIDKVEEAQVNFGESWEEAMNLACEMEGKVGDVSIEWKDAFKEDSQPQDMEEYREGLISKVRYHMRRGMDEQEAKNIVKEADEEESQKAEEAFTTNPPPKVTGFQPK